MIFYYFFYFVVLSIKANGLRWCEFVCWIEPHHFVLGKINFGKKSCLKYETIVVSGMSSPDMNNHDASSKQSSHNIKRSSTKMHAGRQTSSKSFSSLGIGNNSSTKKNQSNQLDYELIKPRPEGFNQNCPQSNAYDCLVFLIYCFEHDKFAITYIDGNTIGLPFVIRDGRNWKRSPKKAC